MTPEHKQDAPSPTLSEERAAFEAPRGTDAQILKERELTAFAIRGAMMFGYQGANPPPDADHWLAEFWEIGREQRRLESLAAPGAAAPSAEHIDQDPITDREQAALYNFVEGSPHLPVVRRLYQLAYAQVNAAPSVTEGMVMGALVAALEHAVEIAENKRTGTWDDLLQYRGLIAAATRSQP